MTQDEVKAVVKRTGVYRIYWDKNDYSLASVGCLYDGSFWFAPANWTGNSDQDNQLICTDWYMVERIEVIETRER